MRNQAERCSRILHGMAPHGRDDTLVRFAPFSSVVEQAAEPHAGRGIRIITRIEGAAVEEGPEVQPELARRPEIIQGLRNLIQNAVDFAVSTVWIDLEWTDAELRVAIGDDGPGYPPDLIGRIGDPFLGRRTAAQPEPQPDRRRTSRLRGDGPRPLHRQDAARAHRRPPPLRQRPAGRGRGAARIRPRHRRHRHRDLAPRPGLAAHRLRAPRVKTSLKSRPPQWPGSSSTPGPPPHGFVAGPPPLSSPLALPSTCRRGLLAALVSAVATLMLTASPPPEARARRAASGGPRRTVHT